MIPLKDYPNYFIDEAGTVYNKHGKPMSRIECERNSGKYRVCLRNNNGSISTAYVHRLVAKTFLDNPNDYYSIGFKDGNIHNVHKDNLYWYKKEHLDLNLVKEMASVCTTWEDLDNLFNIKVRSKLYKEDTELYKNLAERFNAKRTKAIKISRGDDVRVFDSYKEASQYLKVSASWLSACLHNNRKVKGYTLCSV